MSTGVAKNYVPFWICCKWLGSVIQMQLNATLYEATHQYTARRIMIAQYFSRVQQEKRADRHY